MAKGSKFTGKDVKGIRKICLVASTLFNLSAVVYNWTAPIGAALGCVVMWTDGVGGTLARELDETIDEAFELAIQRTMSQSQRKILEELAGSTISIENLNDLIRQTEAYQDQYCTPLDSKEIISTFEACFKDCVLRRPELSRYYLLSMNDITLKQLKKINDTVNEDHENIAAIRQDTTALRKTISKATALLSECTREIAFALMSMAIFLLVGVFSKDGFTLQWIVSALISYAISNLLTHMLDKTESFYKRVNVTFLFIDFGSTLMCMGTFLLLTMAATRPHDQSVILALLALLLGSISGRGIRYLVEHGLPKLKPPFATNREAD